MSNLNDWTLNLLKDKKAEDIVSLKVNPDILYDRFVIATARSVNHLKTLLEYFRKHAKQDNLSLRTDGTPESEWVIIGYNDVMIHIFTDRMRRMYDLEGLYRTEEAGIGQT